MILLDIAIKGDRMLLLNINGPNEDPNFFKNAVQKLDSSLSPSFILGGHFNVVQITY
jgi:hypothetical protein